MAQFDADIALRVQVVDSAIKELEARINKINNTKITVNPYLPSGARRPDAVTRSEADRLKVQQAGLQVDKNRLQLEQQIGVAAAKDLNTRTSWLRVLQEGAKYQDYIARKTAEEAANAAKASQQRLRGGLSSAAIGGAFPLLFGQGAAAAAGGAIGGLAGGLLGGQFGFALSLIGTAIGDAIQKTIDLEKALGSLNRGFQATSSATRVAYADLERLSNIIGQTKEDTIELVKEFSQFDPKTAFALTEGFSSIGGAKTFEAIAAAGVSEKEALKSIITLRKVIGNEAAIQLALDLKINGAVGTQEKLLRLIVDRQEAAAIAAAKQLGPWERTRILISQALALAIQFASALRSIRLPGLPDIFAGLPTGKGFKPLTPEQLTNQRVKEVQETYKRIRNAIGSETKALGTFDTVGDSLSSSGKDKAGGGAKSRLEEYKVEAQLARELLDIERRMGEAKLNGIKSSQAALEIETLLARQKAEIAKINLSDATAAEKQQQISRVQLETDRQLLESSYQRQIETQKLADSWDEIILAKQNDIRLAQTTDGLAKELLKAEIFINEQRLKGVVITEAMVKQYKDLVTEAYKLEGNLSYTDQILQNTVNGAGAQFASLFDTLIQGTNDWNAALTNTLRSLSSLLFQAGLSILGGDDKRGVFSILSGNFGIGGKRAAGGPVAGGTPYLVGEKGPELFVPGRPGAIVPNDALGGGGGGTTVNITLNGVGGGSSTGAGPNKEEAARLARMVEAATVGVIQRERRPGGLLAR